MRFGLREFAAKGTQFTLNGRPIFLRGTLECSVWPLTGYPPTDVPAWQRIYKIMKSYGLNHIRFHSWCPPEAAFAAADLEGILIQVEGPQANVPAGQDPARDSVPRGGIPADRGHLRQPSVVLHHDARQRVRRQGRRARALGGHADPARPATSLFVRIVRARPPPTGSGPSLRTVAAFGGPGTQRDLGHVVASDARPIIGHEIGQWMYFPDFNEMKKYTGVMAAKNFEIIRDDLTKKHLLDLAPHYVQASGKFATLLYKEEIEVLLRTPGYAGFSLLDLHDYPTQGTALVGPLDPFWDSKGFVTPEAFRRYCGPTVPLLRMAKRTFAVDEPFEATVDVAHYGACDIASARPVWTIKDEQGRPVASGKLPAVNLPTGKLTSLGAINASLAKAAGPAKLTVTVALQGTEFANDWEIWVYPAHLTPQPPADVVVTKKWDTAKAALAEGKKVVLFALSGNTAKSMHGGFLPVFWSPVWFPSQKPNTMGLLLDPKHPLFAQFPTEGHSNWQWYELMQRSRLFILDDTAATYRPTLQVIDNFARNHKLGVVFEGRVGKGQLLVCGFDLPAMTRDLAARQFLASLYAYLGSPAFRPAQELGGDFLEGLFVSTSKLEKLHAHIRADSQAPGYDAAQAIDGDPDTMWHTPWGEGAPKFPHELVVEFPKPVKLTGIRCLPRQDGNPNGWIKNYAVHVSADGKDWGQPVAKGAFPQNAEWHTIRFANPVETQFLRLIALSGFDSSQPFASLAELSITVE